MSSQSFSCFVFCFPVSHRSDLPPVLPQRTPFISSPGTTSTRANRMPSCKAGCVFGCWQLTGCRGTLLSPIWPFWVQMRCCGVREPPPSPPRSPKHPPVLMASPSPSVLSRGTQQRTLSFVFVVAQVRDAIALLSLYWDAIPVRFLFSGAMWMFLFANHVESAPR